MSTSNIIPCTELYITSAMQQCIIWEYGGPTKYMGLLGTISVFILDDLIHMQGCSCHGVHHQLHCSPVLRLPAGHYLQIPGILLSLYNPMSTQCQGITALLLLHWCHFCSSQRINYQIFLLFSPLWCSPQCPLPFPFLPLTLLSPPLLVTLFNSSNPISLLKHKSFSSMAIPIMG